MLRDYSPVPSIESDCDSPEAILREAHPLRLAEEVGFIALDSYQWLRPEVHGMVRGWNLLEKAMASTDTRARRDFFSAAELRFGDIANSPTNIDEHLRVSMTLAAMPSFRSRSQGRRPGSKIMTTAYREMSQVLCEVAHRPEMGAGWIGDEENGEILQAHGALTEGLTYTMLLRSNKPGMFPFPAATREDQSKRNLTPYNHDLYTIDKNIGKIAIQTKRNEDEGKAQRRLRDGVATIVLNPLITQEVSNLRRDMIADGEDISWYATYLKLGRPDTFLAQCLDPNQDNFPNAHYAYAASALVKRVSTAVMNTLRPQIKILQETR